MRLLLVEDNPDHCYLIIRCLKREFGPALKVEVAQSGEEALEWLSRIRSQDEPEVILLDYHLPGICGLEVLSGLRERQDKRPVVLMTGVNEQQMALKALRYGADDFVTKGADFPENLIGAVARAQEHVSLSRDLEAARARISVLDSPPDGGQRRDTNEEILHLGQRLEKLGSRLTDRFKVPEGG